MSGCPSVRSASPGSTRWRAGSAGTLTVSRPPLSACSTACFALRSSRGKRCSSCGVTLGTSSSPVANALICGVGGTSPWASTSWLPTSGYQGAFRPSALNGFCACGERPGMRGRVEVGAVVEGIGGVRRLHAGVALGARVRRDRAALERLDRPLELVALRVVDDVAGDEHRLRVLRVQRPDRGVERLRGERLLRPERRVQRRPDPIQERHPRRRLLVSDVRVRELPERDERLARASPASRDRSSAPPAPVRGTRRRWRRRACPGASSRASRAASPRTRRGPA